MHLLLMHFKTADKNHEDAPFEIQIMYASTVSIKLIQGSIRLYCHNHYTATSTQVFLGFPVSIIKC